MSLLGSMTAIAVTLADPTLCKSFMTNFSLEGRDAEILLNILDYILKNKFFKVEGVLGFKISSPDKMRYLKIENKKLSNLQRKEDPR